MPSTIPAAEQAALRAEGEKVIREVVAPAYAKLYAFIREDYMKKARTTLAAEKEPDGPAFYQAQIKGFTTLDLTAEQIHQMGLKEVARIRAEMEQVKASTGFKGDMPAFLKFLRTDPQFYPEDGIRTARQIFLCGETDGRQAARDDRLPAAAALCDPAGASGAGADLYRRARRARKLPDEHLRPAVAAALHADGAHHPRMQPGHSFQAAAAQEATRRSAFRRATGFSGYGEGWALYWEWMGSKLGMYETPYEDFGRLSYEMWRASRLVIDTGIHHCGWSRQQAQDYLRGNTALSEHEITTEIDRLYRVARAGAGVQARRDADPPQARRGRSRARRQVRPAQFPRCDPRAGFGAAAGARSAARPVHRRRRRQPAGLQPRAARGRPRTVKFISS